MAYERREVVTTTPPVHEHTEVVHAPPAVASVDRASAVTYDPYANRRKAWHKLEQGVYLVFGLIEALILIRFILKVMGANPSAGFAQFIYGITDGLVAPFVGLFGTPRTTTGNVFEPHTLVALVVYALVAYLVVRVMWLLFGETRSAVHTSATSVDTHVR